MFKILLITTFESEHKVTALEYSDTQSAQIAYDTLSRLDPPPGVEYSIDKLF
jgi:hypothetical protein